MNSILMAGAGTLFTFLMTCVGASLVFFFKGEIKPKLNKICLGFAAGVMIAASVWSLIIPAINMAQTQGKTGVIEAFGGFVLGGLFLAFADFYIVKLYKKYIKPNLESNNKNLKLRRKSMLLIGTITLHNIPEGMAVGLAFALAAQTGEAAALASAMALALGIGLQNFPEGAAVSLPIRQEGFTRFRSFLYGCVSGVVEPLGGIGAVLLISLITPLLPWFLSFAAGAMIYAVASELIPTCRDNRGEFYGVLSVIFGFAVMMTLDVVLG